MKNKLLVGGLLTTMLFTNLPVVDAMGTANVEFTGNNNITVGETFKVYMNVTNVNDTYDGVVSLGGNLSFDETKLEYVSSKGTETPYLFQMNENYGYKIAGLDFTLDNGIKETLTVYEFTFKALEEGNTTITLTNAKLTDSMDYINTIVVAKEINIKNQKLVEKEITTVETKVETPKKEEIKVIGNKQVIVEKEEKEIENKETNNKIENIAKKEEKTQQQQPKKVKEEEKIVEKIEKILNNLLEKLLKIFK